MERSNFYDSYGTSWADQWDYDQDSVPRHQGKKKSSNSKKVGDGFDKTKSVASTGFVKVKKGTSLGFNWIKDKYDKRNQNKTTK